MKNTVSTLLWFTVILWGIQTVNFLTGNSLSWYGIIPRNPAGLPGILLAPFIHHGFMHLSLNTVPLLVLGGVVLLRGRRAFIGISLWIILLGGAGVWVLGRPAVHAGASGLIYGYFGFLAAAGFYEKKIGSILISLLVIFLYGGMVWGLLPTGGHVSFEAHIAGFFAGIFVARFFRAAP